MLTQLKKILDQVNNFLDRYVLPWPVRFLTFRFVILITIGLLFPLILFANNTVLVLGMNSYLNTMSVALSSIVLLYATISEARQNQIAEMQEKRAQEDHLHVVEMHNLILKELQNQHHEIVELKRVLAILSGKEIFALEEKELPDIKSLHPRGIERFANDSLRKRWQANIYHNALVSTIRQELSVTGDDN